MGDALATDEATRVEAWRCDRLVRIGYPEEAAWYLAARTEVDLSEAEALLKAGCPWETALRLLEPL